MLRLLHPLLLLHGVCRCPVSLAVHLLGPSPCLSSLDAWSHICLHLPFNGFAVVAAVCQEGMELKTRAKMPPVVPTAPRIPSNLKRYPQVQHWEAQAEEHMQGMNKHRLARECHPVDVQCQMVRSVALTDPTSTLAACSAATIKWRANCDRHSTHAGPCLQPKQRWHGHHVDY